ncbi:hypothetical protein VKS41_009408 [Umbelopsis sp. WA50703]
MDATAMPTFGQIVNDPSWTTYWDPYSQASWAWNSQLNYFASYDSEQALKNKMCYAGSRGLAGGMVWLLGQDTSDNKALQAVYNNLQCTVATPRLTNPPATVETEPAPSCPSSGLSKRQTTVQCAMSGRTTVVHMVQVGKGDSFIVETQLWFNTISLAPDTTSAQNMLLTSNGGELRSSKSVLIDGGGSSSTATQNLQYAINSIAIATPPQSSIFDTVIITHSDKDHVGGIANLLASTSSGNNIANGVPIFRPPTATGDPGTAFMHDSAYSLPLRNTLGLQTGRGKGCAAALGQDVWSDNGIIDADAFQSAVSTGRSIIYGQLMYYLASLGTNLQMGTWVSAFGQTNSGNQGGGNSLYFGSLATLIGATNVGPVQNTLTTAFNAPTMCGVAATSASAAHVYNMVSTITQFSTGSKMNMLFTGDLNQEEYNTVANDIPSAHYTILKVAHHCSKFLIPGLHSRWTADVYLISGQTQGTSCE